MTPTPEDKKIATSLGVHEPRDLVGRTVRTVAVLVGACVLFVGTLSIAAVTVANKAVGEPKASDVSETDTAAPKKPSVARPGVTGSQSI
ncbi:MAG: hypothetical protein KF795_25685 [Labilithrix sp.]|nr:hypothetical protein [Labilithrix sp.]